MTASTILIIVIAAFFGVRLFTSNPLEGKWIYEGSGLVMKIRGNGTAVLEWPDEPEEDGKVEMQYHVDMKTKTLTLYVEDEEEKTQMSDDISSESELAAETMEGAYDYSLEQGELTLTEREYGDQMVFMKE